MGWEDLDLEEKKSSSSSPIRHDLREVIHIIGDGTVAGSHKWCTEMNLLVDFSLVNCQALLVLLGL